MNNYITNNEQILLRRLERIVKSPRGKALLGEEVTEEISAIIPVLHDAEQRKKLASNKKLKDSIRSVTANAMEFILMSWEKEGLMSVNKVMLIGRLGQDPELKYTPSGTAVVNFSLATSESWNDKSGEKQDRTEWHRVVVWGKLAELCNQYLAKGRQAFVEGSLQTRSWEGKDGNKRYTTEINAKSVNFLGGNAPKKSVKESTPSPESAKAKPSSNSEYSVCTDADFTADDIPF